MNNVTIFKYLAIFEGISYIVLLGICMPLKYIWEIPEPTRPVGMAHGVLFVAYMIWLLIVGLELKWNFKILVIGFIASLLPFTTFIFEKKYLPVPSK
jgi:integral membrane protein